MKKFKWSSRNSITLSRVCVAVIAVLLLAADAFGFRLVDWFLGYQRETLGGTVREKTLLLVSLYALSVPAWLVLALLWRLLKNVAAGQVFTAGNVAALRGISWCGVAAFLLCFASGFYYAPWFLPGVAAGFVALLVRVVKNCFQQAVLMRDELDYTV